MKKILLLIFLMTISLGYSQGVAQNFETGGINGAPFASGAAPTVTREAGPSTNTSQAIKFVGNTGSQQWQGVNLSLTTNLNLTAATTRTMSIDVYADGPLFFLVKVNGGIAGAPEAAAVVEYTGTNTWQTCSFTFNSVRDGKAAAANGTYAGFVLHPYWPSAAATVFAGGNAAARTLWVDNITGPLALPSATVGAFTVPAKLVGDATFTITPPTSNNTSAFTYASSNTAVATIVNGNQIQVGSSGSSTITASQVSDGTYSATSSTATFSVTPPPPPSAPTPPARNEWDVVSLYSDSYTATSGATWQAGTNVLTSVGNNARFFDGFTLARLAFAARSISAMTTLHIDVYTINQNQLWFEINGNRKVVSSIPLNGWASFDIPLTDYVGLNLGNVSFFDLNNPTGAAAPVKQVYLDNIYFYRAATDAPPTIGSLTVTGPRVVGDAPFTLTDPTSNSSGAWSYSASPAGILTFSGNTATIVGGGTATITATQAAVTGVYGSASTTATLVVNFPAPGPSPIPPVRDPASVVSLYTGTPTTYANAVTAVQASWSTGSTNSNFSFANGTNTCIQVNNLGFFGLVGASNFSVVGMTKMHVDIYVNTPMTTMILNLLAPSDRNYSIGPLVAGWNSFDIPLTIYPGALNNIAGIKFEQSGGTPRQIYIDNVYFYAGGTPTITSFPAITKVNGDAPFSLTAPTSDSPGAFTYTSSNEAVATISGSTVTVVGQGTSTITATQAASGFFTTGSITATLTVTGSTVPLAGPTAPPARNAWDALSVFSDAAYTVIPGTRNYNPNWGQAGAGAVVTAGSDNVWRASNLNYQGIVIGSNADVSAMTHFHVDVWTFNETSLQFFLISNTTGERSVALAAPYGALTQGSWISYDIPLTAWTSQSGFTTTAIKEFKIVGSGGKTVYMDNMYFYRAATTQPPTIGAFTVPAQVTGVAPFTLTPPTSNSAGAFTYTSSNTAVATISGDTVTIVGSGSSTITATQAADGSYGTGSVTATLSVTPSAAPTPPTRNAWDVVSLYSNSYTATAGATWQAGTNVDIAGNDTRLFNGFTLARLAFAPTSIATMTTLHIDVYTINQNQLWFEIQGNRRVESSIPLNGWVSFDIPLSSFTGLNLANISFFDLNNPTGAQAPVKVVYLDNIYFYRPATDQPPTIGALSVPSPQVLGNAPFTLTNPTSNSSGAWTYSASPSGIVTFSGNTATIVGGGTATITASQAAVAGEFGPGSASATLVVTFPDPTPSPALPEREASRVVSLYTGSPAVYTNAPNYNFGQAFWSTGGGRVLTEVPNGTNTALRIDGLGFMGLIDIGNPPPTNRERRINLVGTGMTHLNIDIYLDAPRPNLFLVLLAPGDRLYNTGALTAGWNRLRVPLTAYPGALNDIYGLKIEQNYTSAFRIFIDNIYFSNDLFTFYADADGDGFGNLASTIVAETAPSGYVTNSTDCNDSDNSIWQSGSFYVDFDNDGYHLDLSPDSSVTTLCYGATLESYYKATTLGADCDDTNEQVWRSGSFYVDADADGYSPNASSETLCYGANTPSGYAVATLGVDCNDASASVWRSGSFYVDADADGYSPNASSETLCYGANTPSGYAVGTLGLDCDDTIAAVNPGHVEVLYNGIDDNCNGQLDEGFELTTPLQTASCGTTLSSMGSLVYASINSTATGYRFKVVNNTTNATQIINRNFHWFAMNMLADYQYATTYTISVELQKAGVWLGYYGPTCSVSTPAVLSSTGALQVNPSQCGITLPSIGTVISTTPLSGATGYRFKVTNITEGATGANLVQVRERSYHWFTLPMLTRFNYGSTYMIEVAVKTTAGYSLYGSACTVTTPSAPTLVQCGGVIATGSTLVTTTPMSSVTQYRFQVTKVSDQTSVTFDRNLHWFRFGSNVPGYTPNAAYAVRIAVMTAGTWSPFGDACIITSPAAAARGVEVGSSTFEAQAFPNPFTSEFKLNVTTSTEGAVELRVYDMLGKLIETRSINTIDYISEDLGSTYPAGVYNVIVTQGENMKTLRMIKR